MRTRLLTLSCALGLLGFGCAADATGEGSGNAVAPRDVNFDRNLGKENPAPDAEEKSAAADAGEGEGKDGGEEVGYEE